jgi:bidirectional [NiFe] hydrogenase diaphorase subunit
MQKLQELAQKERDRQEQFESRLFCCSSTACLATGSISVQDAINQKIETLDQKDKMEVVPIGCMGLCSRGPLVKVSTKGQPEVMYQEVGPELAQEIVVAHQLGAGETAFEEHIQNNGQLKEHILPQDTPFFTKQHHFILAQSGTINPEKLEDYLAHDGYTTLENVLENMSPEEVCDEIKASGLRGRGGAGFPVGTKWHFGRQAPGDEKYVIINGDEGDPGAYMDRTMMEQVPHRILEGLIIAAYAIGASQGYIYVRGEYPIAIQRLQRAIRAAKRRGILGKSVMGTDFVFNADVRIGAGAFVCGEETALMQSVEGKRGMPVLRPPYPTTAGLWGKPTVINNVETMANIVPIIQGGAEAFASIGTETSKGTKVFALTGQLNFTGLIEVPMGITLREIIYEIGGGIPNDIPFKAAQTGGPSGGCISADYLDTPVDYENLKKLGSIMGSGGLVIMDETSSMPEIARFFMEFCVDESCGKCVPCRVGTVQIYSLLDKLIAGNGVLEDLDRLEKLCHTVINTSLCGLGMSAPNPVISTLKYFRHEYESLISDTVAEETSGKD